MMNDTQAVYLLIIFAAILSLVRCFPVSLDCFVEEQIYPPVRFRELVCAVLRPSLEHLLAQAKLATMSGRGCYNCGEDGHMSRDCPTGRRTGGGGGGRSCYNCGEDGHISRECPTRGGGGGGGGGGQKCYNCGNFGHISRECTEPRAERVCYGCNKPGHVRSQCPEGN
ncbi:hypothetical protein QR680_003615 [Steinernema hermaphroditum]|uniref:CCHC-type domain-containing protein n=1 Tax=Steinernema hermaphroditum TaxID=289476 RepID=A0AA39LRU6_9BILA|nr:hypothetical protein QR680_003615 [Steinernema hermaphroditum]